ncbi:hypothetical protein QE152_g39318 [Popillia japonica]|uniref:Uncharacterized protein n=1 Tax=Popillia japonica TaxID=7064 RepID=A0AAW1HTW6_POPJA
MNGISRKDRVNVCLCVVSSHSICVSLPDLRSNEWHFAEGPGECVSLCGIKSLDILTVDQQQRVSSILDYHFEHQRRDLGCTSLVKHVIRTTAEPIKQRYYPVSPVMQQHIDTELNEMLRLGVIEKSNSPWASPIVMVKKKDSTYRFWILRGL